MSKKHIIRIIFLIIALIILILATPAKASAPLDTRPKVLTVRETIVKYVTMYAAPEAKLTSLFRCESTFNQNAIGEEGEIGVGQFKQGTFTYLSGLMGEKLDINSYTDQIKLISWLSVNKPEEMRHWTTWRAIENGGTYTFTSKKLGKTYTVNCK